MRALLVAVFALLSLANSASGRTAFPYYGDTGVTGSPDECLPGQYFIGTIGNAGLWLDQISVICGTLTPDNSITGSKTIASRGGSGGTLQKVMCDKDEVITRMYVQRTPQYQISWGDFTCLNIKTGKTHDVGFGGTRGGVGNGANMQCPAGELGTGMTIRWGKYVNGLGLICNTYVPPKPTPVATTPPNPAPPAGTTNPAPPAFIKVVKDVDVYNPPPCDADTKKKTSVVLRTGTSNVKLVANKNPWFQVTWPGGSGCVYSGPGYISLQLP